MSRVDQGQAVEDLVSDTSPGLENDHFPLASLHCLPSVCLSFPLLRDGGSGPTLLTSFQTLQVLSEETLTFELLRVTVVLLCEFKGDTIQPITELELIGSGRRNKWNTGHHDASQAPVSLLLVLHFHLT